MPENRTPPEIWDKLKRENPQIPEPGERTDRNHGIAGDPEPLPDGDAENDEEF